MATSPDRIEQIIKELRDAEEGIFEPQVAGPSDPNHVALFGGICGVPLSVPDFTICDGLLIRQTFAHVMAPYLLAFAPPKKRGAPHPAPWKSARGGLGFDVTVEIMLTENCRPTGFDRINTLWWVLALLRLATGAPLRMTVFSNMAFAAVPESSTEPVFWTVEMPPHQLCLVRNPPTAISVAHLEWVRKSLVDGAVLMDTEHFNRVVQTFDSAIWAHSLGSAIVMVWAAIETLFRPGWWQITKTLSKCIATYLYPAGGDRDRAYQKVEQLYEARGSAAHNSYVPESEQLFDSFQIARRCIVKCIDDRLLPDADDLVRRWKAKS